MKNYILQTKDSNGQPLQVFKANFENNVSKAIDQLSGICTGILADGVVSEQEAAFFADWVKKFALLEPIWPFTDILGRVERIFADGHCDQEERQELKDVMESLCGYTADSEAEETYSSALPLNSPEPELIFPSRIFNITGRFAYGTRKKVMEAIESKGGKPSDSPPNRESHYLVIGVFASRDWFNTNYGRKIERGVELRESGSGLAIISEEHWKSFLSPWKN